MPLAVLAYISVLSVSSRLMEAGEMVAIIDVLVRPPKESWSSRVNLDSLQKNEIHISIKVMSAEF